MRTWSQTKSTFEAFFAGHDTSIFVHTYDAQYRYHPAIEAELANHKESYLSCSDIADYFVDLGDQVKAINYNNLSKKLEIDKSKFHTEMNKLGENCYTPISNVVESLQDLMVYEQRHEVRFDYIIRVRPDAVFRENTSIQLPLYNNQVFINNGIVFPNDWFLCASRDTFIAIYERLVSEFKNPSSQLSYSKPPHGLFESVFNRLGLEVQQKPFIQGLLRVDGFIDNYISINKYESIRYYLFKMIRKLKNKVYKWLIFR